MNIIILGSPASGKGTQAELLANRLGLFHLQGGEIARDLAGKDARIAKIVNSGKLIPQDEMTMYVIDYLNKNKPDYKDIIYEGFPRFISQYEALEKFLGTKGVALDYVITLDISKKEAVKRISSRRICTKCGEVYNLITNPPVNENKCNKCGGELIQRKDDNPESVETRFEYYKKNTKELVDYIEGKGKLVKIDGERPIEDIYNDILTKIKANVK